MKNLILSTFVALLAFNVSFAQKDKAKRPSPPAQAVQTVGGKKITIDYSQPSVKGRNVWDVAGDLAPYGKVWRTGANEAAWFETSAELTINGKKLPAGKYGFFTIPNEKEWVIIFNKKWNQWGSYDYKEADDVLRVTVPALKASATERFTVAISDKGEVSLRWAEVETKFSVK